MAKRSRSRRPTVREELPASIVSFQSDRLRIIANNLKRALTANGFTGRLSILVQVEAKARGEAFNKTYLHPTKAAF